MALFKIETIDDFKKVIRENTTVIIDVYATWCNPCRTIAPFFYELAHANTHVLSAKVNCEDSPDVAQFLEITSIPTFIKFKNGKRVETVFGPDKNAISNLYNV